MKRARGFGASSLALSVAALLSVGAALAAPGDLDPTFDEDGVVTTPFPVGAFATAIAIQDDGRLVAVGSAAGPSVSGEFAVARYESDGALDPTFGDGGMLVTPIRGGNGDEARSVAIQPNGRIVVAGTDGWERFAVVRYLPDGELDPSFGGNGIVRTNFTPGDDVAWDMAIQADGKIVAVGGAGFGQEGFFLARYRRNGELDAAFGDGGKVVTRYRGANARAVVLQPDGRIVVAGYNTFGLAVARYRTDGRLDRSFGDRGVVHPHAPIFALAVALQSNGRIVAAGDCDIFRVGVARFLPDGGLDRSFSGDGLACTSIGSGEQAFHGLVVQPHGRIVAAGAVGPHEDGTPADWHFILARYLPDGHLDGSFGVGGTVETALPGGGSGQGIVRQADGRVVVVGGTGADEAFALVRYLT